MDKRLKIYIPSFILFCISIILIIIAFNLPFKYDRHLIRHWPYGKSEFTYEAQYYLKDPDLQDDSRYARIDHYWGNDIDKAGTLMVNLISHTASGTFEKGIFAIGWKGRPSTWVWDRVPINEWFHFKLEMKRNQTNIYINNILKVILTLRCSFCFNPDTMVNFSKFKEFGIGTYTFLDTGVMVNPMGYSFRGNYNETRLDEFIGLITAFIIFIIIGASLIVLYEIKNHLDNRGTKEKKVKKVKRIKKKKEKIEEPMRDVNIQTPKPQCCPSCGVKITFPRNYCQICGVRINWFFLQKAISN